MKKFLTRFLILAVAFFVLDYFTGQKEEREVTVVSATLRKYEGTCTVFWDEGVNTGGWGNRCAYIDSSRWNEVEIGKKLKLNFHVGGITRIRYYGWSYFPV